MIEQKNKNIKQATSLYTAGSGFDEICYQANFHRYKPSTYAIVYTLAHKNTFKITMITEQNKTKVSTNY